MALLYNVFLGLYGFGILLASSFHKKARKFLFGRLRLFSKLENAFGKDDKILWFHAASLGEFEQGRPVIEEIKSRFPQFKILLTFFSPSGYEIRKNYEGADYICYLPIDFSWNAKRFVKIIQPKAVFFIKYEFWNNYTRVLHYEHIPVYCFSSIFRPGQLFFKCYGAWYRNILSRFDHLFVQNELSKKLLETIGITDISVSGDTRFDRVANIAKQTKQLPVLEKFKNDSLILIAGSTWPADEEILINYINENSNVYKYIIAPHEISNSAIDELIQKINKKSVRYSEADAKSLTDYNVLIIDNIGMLSSIYKYGNIAYIGGGFGKGIHNILEAATFGLPVIFGPKYKKFHEAVELIEKHGAFSINDYSSFKKIMDEQLENTDIIEKTSMICKKYIEENKGATEKIISGINLESLLK
jgi:3-deoxy-D-manno-octulosonic-acid transferase